MVKPPAPSPTRSRRLPPAPSPGAPPAKLGFPAAPKPTEEHAATPNELERAKLETHNAGVREQKAKAAFEDANQRAHSLDEVLTIVGKERDDMAEVLEPYGPHLRTALRQAERALLHLARMASCAHVNASGEENETASKALAREELAREARLQLAGIREAQRTARTADLIPSV